MKMAPVSASNNHMVVVWLMSCCALLFAMISIGGITRLTHSGLSIVEWQPIVGTFPPFTEAQWQDAFGKYRLTPEYLQVNQGMSLDAFKGIFWWEYIHRLLGRLIGIAFLLPLLWFTWKGRIERRLLPRLAGIFVLGALQGAMGWYMVASGLVDDPRVSQYRLTAHLGLAFLIYGAILWVALELCYPRVEIPSETSARRKLTRLSTAIVILIFMMVLTGGLVAGIRAGFAYNTFPLMNGHVFPPDLFMIEPFYLNFFNNMATVQFDHRLLALTLAILVFYFWLQVRNANVSERVRRSSTWLLCLIVLQVSLGVATLLLVVPLTLAVAHQACAVLVLTAGIYVLQSLR